MNSRRRQASPYPRAFLHLGSIKQAGGKIVAAWAFEGDCEPDKMISNTCEVEWPPRSGRLIEVPEADRGAWFSIAEAHEHIKSTQIPLIDRLLTCAESDRIAAHQADPNRYALSNCGLV